MNGPPLTHAEVRRRMPSLALIASSDTIEVGIPAPMPDELRGYGLEEVSLDE